ncbi:thioredoxin-related protein [Ulvibacter sp. MAR_2010_11]|uniref:thioredoxin family protein n=1 Tax=Ulvibacter sp. MAR_2010_11 TaxID=1250229 RepID=UPI000C2CC791|nr:thioredoxin family protein [Ulvibacter sp. MAR_2010_11]PKA83509.1 thioredoxin-related protein [Ulvibacter sp. MAR_2010_11]
MKKLLIIFTILIAGTLPTYAQEWVTDITVAKQQASENNYPIVLVFQGSDWCAPCIKLDREIWSTPEFKEYAKNHFVMLQADFPKKKKNVLPEALQQKNNSLAQKYNPQGIFPFVVVLDKNGKKLGETGYIKTSPKDYIKNLVSFTK